MVSCVEAAVIYRSVCCSALRVMRCVAVCCSVSGVSLLDHPLVEAVITYIYFLTYLHKNVCKYVYMNSYVYTHVFVCIRVY